MSSWDTDKHPQVCFPMTKCLFRPFAPRPPHLCSHRYDRYWSFPPLSWPSLETGAQWWYPCYRIWHIRAQSHWLFAQRRRAESSLNGPKFTHKPHPQELTCLIGKLLLVSSGEIQFRSDDGCKMEDLLLEPSALLVRRALKEHPIAREDSDAETV